MNSFEYYKDKKCKHLLFHGNDIVLIDKVIECSESCIIVNANLDKDSPLLDTYNGLKVFRIYKSIEMMAQSLGCFQYINMSMLGECKAKIGFLLGARKFEIYIPHIEYNQEIFIETKLSVQNDDGFGVYDSTIYVGSITDDNKAASTVLSVLLISNPKESIAFIYYSSVMHIITVVVFWAAINYLVFMVYSFIMSMSLLSEKSEKTSEELKKITNRD